MAYVPVYQSRINWKNYPIETTPLNDVNLNKLDYAAYVHDRTIKELMDNSIKRIDYNTSTGTFYFTYWNGTVDELNFAIAKIPATFSLDRDGVVHMVDDNGVEYTADLKDNMYYIEVIDIETVGTPSATTVSKQEIVVNDDRRYEVPGTKFMRQSVVMNGSPVTVTFTNSEITEYSVIDVYTSSDKLNYDDIALTNGQCQLQYSGYVGELTVTLYIK